VNYLHEAGMRRYTEATLTEPAALDADLAAGLKRGMQVEIGQYRPGVACAAVSVVSPEAVEGRTVLACALPIRDMMHSAKQIRSQLQAAAASLVPLLS
jgi:DNA-binding IclR family transcriptional regulator